MHHDTCPRETYACLTSLPVKKNQPDGCEVSDRGITENLEILHHPNLPLNPQVSNMGMTSGIIYDAYTSKWLSPPDAPNY